MSLPQNSWSSSGQYKISQIYVSLILKKLDWEDNKNKTMCFEAQKTNMCRINIYTYSTKDFIKGFLLFLLHSKQKDNLVMGVY